jgi:predicted enzyme related to lactoylglutathione lyase
MNHPARGQLGYLQLPALDVERSAAFYASVFGWSVDAGGAGFTAPHLIGQWTTDRPPAPAAGPLLWICVDSLYDAVRAAPDAGGRVVGRPWLDGGERWLAEVEDPAGNRIGVVAPVSVARSQTLLTVRDVEASSRWYQELLGLRSDHGGPQYERLLAGDRLVLQLHHEDVEHHHGRIAEPGTDRGHGVLVWFGEVADFDGVVERAARLGAPVVREPHRNPPAGQGNGPAHREVWVRDPDGYVVVVASPDGEDYEP